MNGFTRLFSTIVTSTVWRESDKTRIVWITMLALMNEKGIVPASVPGLAALANVETEECRDALGVLLSPDKDSRTKEHEGRRIAEVDGGWSILNHGKYKDIGREMDRTEYLRKAQTRSRRRRQEEIPEVTEPSLLKFPCDGEPPEWNVVASLVKRWRGHFPSLDIGAECRNALAWIEASPERRKTARGMKRFLVGWFGRAQNGGQRRGGSSATAPVNVRVGHARAEIKDRPSGEVKL